MKTPPPTKKIQILTIGGATQDIFLIAKDFAPVMHDGQPFLVLPAQQKVDVPDIANQVGGGAVNAAIAFARVGLKTACLAKVGADGAGFQIDKILKLEKVSSLLHIDKSHQTGISVIMKGPKGEDTIFTHRGAGYEYQKRSFATDLPDSEWLYMTSLAGDVDLMGRSIVQAALQGTRIAVNPGGLEIRKARKLVRILRSVDVIILNQFEAAQLLGSSNDVECFRQARRYGWHTVVITNSGTGCSVLDGSYIYRSDAYKTVSVIDRTGAGDAFGAGLIAAIASGQSMQQAISFAGANATSVIGYIGASIGLLRNLDVEPAPVKLTVFEATS